MLSSPLRSLLPLPRSVRVGAFIACWFFTQVRAVKAENSLSYKYVDYRESGDRMAVESQYGLLEQDLGADMRLKLQGVIDSIAGATPTGQPPKTPGGPVPLSHLTDRRKAWSADLSRQFPRVNATVGFANSRENDYVSNGLSLNTLTDFNQKNTTLLLGVAGTNDDIKVLFQNDWVKKRTTDLVAGITQLVDPLTSVTFNVSYGRSTGYHADPYRVIQQTVEVAPGVFLPLTFGENRPGTREKWIGYGAVNRSFPPLHGALEASYRLFHDTFGTTAHTLELSWFQKFGEHLTLRPGFRYYDQTAADFYRLDITGTNYTPTGKPQPAGPFYSADYRLSAFRSYNYGLKVIWTINAAWRVDVSYDRYEMHGKDSVTSPSVYPRAGIFNAGITFSW
jgi:hypothetical protein